MRQLLLLLLGCCGLSLFGQSFQFPPSESRIYPISARLVDQLIAGTLPFDELPQLANPYPVATRTDTLPAGHYLTTSLSGEVVRYDYFNTYDDYEVAISAAGGNFQFRLYDPAGRERADAVVTADGKPVRYTKKHQAYRRRDWRIGELKIIVAGDTLFYRVDEAVKTSRFAHDWRVISSRQPLQTLKLPYYYGASVYQTFKDGIGKGRWHWPRNYPLQNTIRRITRPEEVTGYVTTSQPRYRPGDTLQISAYLAFPKGRPVNVDSLDMLIQTYGRGANKRFRTKVGGNEKGRYVHTMALPSDWPLDQSYRVSFSFSGWRWRSIAPTISFQLQDYELAEYQLATEITDDARLPASAWLDVNAQDINGLPLPNGNIKVTLLLDRFLASRKDSTIVRPDTLFVHAEPTDNRLDRRIILPDSLFPAGYAIGLTVKTQLTGPSGEYKEATNQLTIDRRYPSLPKLEVRKDSLVAFLAPASAPPSTSAFLQTIRPAKDTVTTPIVLPFRLPIDHTVATYRLVYGEQSEQVEIDQLAPWTGQFFSWSRDTLRFSFTNLHGQPLIWELRHNDKLLASGDEATPTFQRAGFAPGYELQLTLRYRAGGAWKHEKQPLIAPRYDLLTDHKNVLDLQLSQPAKVTPGETVRITLTATDQQGRPAENVRLTAGSFNARFDKTPVTTPTYQKRNKRRRQRQQYQRESLRLNKNSTPPRWLVADYGLDTALAYQLRYPDAEFTFSRDLDTLLPRRVEHAHFAPFVIVGHQPVTVRTAYVDDRLVYWYHPDITTPYSIPVDSGWHDISLRTDQHRYTKRLYFESCRQLVLSFDAERWVTAGWARTQVPKWTDAEVDRVYERVFALTQMTTSEPVYFRTEPGGIIQTSNRVGGAGWSPLGLAGDKDLLRFWFSNGDSVDLRFEPQAAYRISMERDRLYPLKKETVAYALHQRARTKPSMPGLPQYNLQRRVKLHSPSYLRLAGRLPRLIPLEPVSRLQFTQLPKALSQVIVSPVANDDFYFTDLSSPNRVSPGVYDVLYHFSNDSVFHQLVTLGEDSLTLIPFQRSKVKYYNDFDRTEGYSQNKPPKPQEPMVVYTTADFAGDRISGIVVDEDGTLLPYASVYVKGSNQATVTDLDGNFSLDVPNKDFTLMVSYTGYEPFELKYEAGAYIPSTLVVTMSSDGVSLDEVVIIGYGVQLREQDNTTTGQLITSDQVRNLPTREINQIAGISAGAISLEEGAAFDIRGSRSDATEYYVDGVRTSETAQALPPVSLRSSFSDYAAFVPELRTDRAGKAVFDVTFPDDITAWNTYAVGQDRRRRIGFTLARTVAFLPLQAQLYLPRFLVEGDRAEAATLAINREEGERAVRLSFAEKGVVARPQEAKLADAIEQRYPIEARSGVDSMTYAFTVQATDGDQASDGEQRSLPVYPKGTEMVDGALLMLTDKTTALPAEFIRPERGPVTLRLPGNRIQQLLNDLDYLIGYRYACTEQTASRLVGLLQLSDIRRAEGKTFTMTEDILKMIARLEKLRRPDGGFGWWGSSEESTPWISLHVYQALSMAGRAGYAVAELYPVRRYLLGRLPELPARDQLQILLTLAEEGNPPTDAELTRIDTFTAPNDYEWLAVTRLQQLRGDTIDVDSLVGRSTRHAALGRYWGRRGYFFYRQPLDNRLACGLLAHRILADAGETAFATETINYMLGQTAARNRPGNVPLLGTNTLESARMLAELLPALLTEAGALSPPIVTLQTGTENERIVRFPYEKVIPPDDVARLRLQRDGSGPLPLTLYQRWFETQPTAKDDGFLLTSKLLDARGRPLDQLALGTTAYLEVTVISQAEADYVLIEVPIPAGCSYADRAEGRGRWAVHREYQRDRVAIFCDRLPAGTYTFKVALEPRFSGSYTLNPARAEMQYLPVVNGNGSLETVEIR